MMTTERLKNWIKAQDPDYSGCIQLGSVDGNAEQALGVYPAPTPGAAQIAIGGPDCTTYCTFCAKLLLRWGKHQPEAEAKARALWGLFYGLTGVEMCGTPVAYADPGGAPVPLGRSTDGTFEYVIDLKLICKKE